MEAFCGSVFPVFPARNDGAGGIKWPAPENNLE